MNQIFRKKNECVLKKAGNEFLLVPIADNIASMNSLYTLNEVGAFIWEKIDGSKTLAEIVQEVIAEYDVDEKTASQDILHFTEKIKDLIEEI